MLDDASLALMSSFAPRLDLSRYPLELEVRVDRAAVRFSSWYELFPRSQSGDPHRHGTFEDVIERLPYMRDLGFDVLYFPPIHPIGRTNRKGRNNALIAEPDDPGSTYAIGAEEGGHTNIHPELGTPDDFHRLVSAARAHGIEIALDFAVQCSLDHPWIKEHPEWFEWRPDGSIKFSENPPKKYEDIVNVRFDSYAFPAIWYALREVVLFWLDQGVKIFRVDNPHTKPIPFWKWLIDEVNAIDREVIFLAEAFTRPKMMKKLAKVGFQQSYTYFTWRNTKSELVSYMVELAGEMGEYYRPNFFVNTPDINPYYLQTSGRPASSCARRLLRCCRAIGAFTVASSYVKRQLCQGGRNTSILKNMRSRGATSMLRATLRTTSASARKIRRCKIGATSSSSTPGTIT
jgi:starch synthase (maltosyl-transferring)